MPDRAAKPPDDPSHFRRGGPSGVFAFEVAEPFGGFATIFVDHRDEGDTAWSEADSVSVHAPGVMALRVSGLKEVLRLRLSIIGDRPAQIHVLPPQWLPF